MKRETRKIGETRSVPKKEGASSLTVKMDDVSTEKTASKKFESLKQVSLNIFMLNAPMLFRYQN